MNLKVLSIVMGLLLSLCGYRATAKSSEQNVEWKAKWISSGTTREQPNTWLNFRKEVNLPNVPTSVIARIGADSKYWLWINGKPVVFEGGLKRGPNPLDTYYDEVEIAPYLKRGENTIAVLLWYFGRPSFSHNDSGKAGLLFDCQTPSFDILSNDSWKCEANPAYGTCPPPDPNMRLAESNIRYDARKAGRAWHQPDFNADEMPQAVENGTAGSRPWNKLVLRPIPLWKVGELQDYPSQVRNGDTIVCTLPYNAQITPYIKLKASSGDKVQIFTDNYLKYNGGDNYLRCEYIARDGYAALAKVLGMQPDHVLQEIIDSGLRGRGGGGFPTGLKWKITRDAKADRKYVVCNADEGDPGAFMDRSILEGDPHSILEAMAINGYCTGASHGLIYIRAEYPLAIERLRRAIEQAREYGLLGNDILGSGLSFDIELRYGAGAFVCGEETALIHSMEGRRGEPTVKPPYPSESGYKGYPTNVNNVETYANIPPIILRGAEWFSSIGTEKIDLMQIKELLQAHLSGEAEEERRAAAAAIESEKRRKAEKVSTQSSGDALIIDEKIGQLDYKLAKCCNPIHGDEIFGFITVGAGITIHRTDCPNAQRLRRNYPYRVLEARWRDEAQGAFRVSIRVVASDTTGMINHIAEVINRDLKLSIRSMNLSPGGGLLSGVIHVEVPGTGMVDMLIHSILRIKGVQKAYRVNN